MESHLLLKSVISCPVCGFEKEEAMPIDACLYFYTCTNCGIIIKPKQGYCCVFCSYGTVPCPPVQMQKPCC
ncbi:MAG: GDCCVxC domain-containing (seleno)protein [Candidatus Dadabacteria bacterium]